jgi:hypothetical protein
MEKVLLTIFVISILALGALAFAQGTGIWGVGYMMEPGHGNHMMGNAHMMGQMGVGSPQDQKFLDETAGLRRELHNKKFEYFEAVRSYDTKREMISQVEKTFLYTAEDTGQITMK